MQTITIQLKESDFALQVPECLWTVEKANDPDDGFEVIDKKFNELNRDDLPKNPTKSLILLHLFYPNIDPHDYIFFAQQKLGLSNEKIFDTCAAMGYLDALQCFTINNLYLSIRRKHWGFYYAFLCGHLDTLEWFKKSADYDEMLTFCFDQHKGTIPTDSFAWLKKPENAAEFEIYYTTRFKTACGAGDLNQLTELKEQISSQQLSTLIESTEFTMLALEGYFDILKLFAEWAPEQFKSKITEDAHDYNSIFHDAAIYNRIDFLNLLKKKTPECLKEMFLVYGYGHDTFNAAAENGLFDILKWLKKQALHLNLWDAMVCHDEYRVFPNVARHGLLRVLRWLKKYASNELMPMIRAQQYGAFRTAACHGHLDVLKWLKKQASEELLEMIRADGYAAFRWAATHGHWHILKWLAEQGPNELAEMIRADNYGSFYGAVLNGHINIFEWIVEHAPNELSAMIKAGNYRVVLGVAGRRRFELVRWLLEQMPDEVAEVIKTNNYFIVREAIARGRFDIIKWLAKKAPHEVLHMIQVDNYLLFRQAAALGRVDLLKWIAQRSSNAEVTAIIQADGYAVYNDVCSRLLKSEPSMKESYEKCLMWLLQNPQCYANTWGMTPALSSEIVDFMKKNVMPSCFKVRRDFTIKTLEAIHSEKTRHSIDNPTVVFDIGDPQKSQLCFYIIRDLINDLPDDNCIIQFLLAIPSVRALAHQELTKGKPNELIQCALEKSNKAAAAILLDIEAVCKLAAEHDFYPQVSKWSKFSLKEIVEGRKSLSKPSNLSVPSISTGQYPQENPFSEVSVSKQGMFGRVDPLVQKSESNGTSLSEYRHFKGPPFSS